MTASHCCVFHPCLDKRDAMSDVPSYMESTYTHIPTGIWNERKVPSCVVMTDKLEKYSMSIYTGVNHWCKHRPVTSFLLFRTHFDNIRTELIFKREDGGRRSLQDHSRRLNADFELYVILRKQHSGDILGITIIWYRWRHVWTMEIDWMVKVDTCSGDIVASGQDNIRGYDWSMSGHLQQQQWYSVYSEFRSPSHVRLCTLSWEPS